MRLAVLIAHGDDVDSDWGQVLALGNVMLARVTSTWGTTPVWTLKPRLSSNTTRHACSATSWRGTGGIPSRSCFPESPIAFNPPNGNFSCPDAVSKFPVTVPSRSASSPRTRLYCETWRSCAVCQRTTSCTCSFRLPRSMSNLQGTMEPRTSTPTARLRAIRVLAESGIPVGVMVAPIVPGLNDSEVPGILAAAKSAGAMTASYVLLRLPLTVEPVFREWLERTRPDQVKRILGRVQQTRAGQLNSSTFGERMVGGGEIADQIQKLFRLFKQKHGLDKKLPTRDCSRFRPPTPSSGQRRLF